MATLFEAPELTRAGPIREHDPRRGVRRRDATFRRSLALADVLAAGAAITLAVAGIGSDTLRPELVLALPLVLIAAKLQGVYDRDEIVVNKTTLDQAPQLFGLATLYTLLFVVLEAQFVDGHLGSTQVVGLWASTFVLTLLGRRVARAFARHVSAPERCLFVGAATPCERVRGKLASCGGHAVIVGRIEFEPHAGLEVAEAAELHRLVAELRIHRVIVEPSAEATHALVREVKATGARVSVYPHVLEVLGSSFELDDVQGLTLLGVRHFGLSRSSAALKRAFDLTGAVLGLLALSPVLAVIGVLVRLDSHGPVIYRQPRIGRDGRTFTIWKFRTMVDGADALKASLRDRNEADGLFKMAHDPRVTRVGRQLRRLSLDELPQLVNVVRGEMSLVGPRPLVADDDGRVTGLDRRRLSLTPGMTGHWQVLGSARLPLAEMTKLDYLYVANWSLWTDVKLLLRTVPYLLARRGM